MRLNEKQIIGVLDKHSICLTDIYNDGAEVLDKEDFSKAAKDIADLQSMQIELDKYEVRWIKFCKGHYQDKYKTNARNWVESLKPIFEETYGWSPDEHYNDYLFGMFQKLLDIFLKIQLDQSGHNALIKEVFNKAFDNRSIRRDYKLPIERAIAELCGQIQCVTVVVDDVERFKLD